MSEMVFDFGRGSSLSSIHGVDKPGGGAKLDCNFNGTPLLVLVTFGAKARCPSCSFTHDERFNSFDNRSVGSGRDTREGETSMFDSDERSTPVAESMTTCCTFINATVFGDIANFQ